MQLKYTWLPDSLPDNNNSIQIKSCSGSHLILADGRKIYDGISSWWCKPLGHQHQLVKDSFNQQLELFEHHIPANAYNEGIEELSTLLINIFNTMDRVMYASDGSSAVEIACKLSLEVRNIEGSTSRNKFIALTRAYHGETIFTLSICGINSYKAPYKNVLAENYFIEDIVYVNSRNESLWNNCNFDLPKWDKYFSAIASYVTALIIEPIVQGANGLKIISRDFLYQIITLARKYNIHIISDEIMVGLGRLGCHSVSKEILNFEPDLVCFGKNLTCGSIPMSAVVIKHNITDIFRKAKRSFPHSHTHSCNALATRVAINYLKFLKTTDFLAQVQKIEAKLLKMMERIKAQFTFVSNPRAIGGIAACHLDLAPNILDKIFAQSIKEGIYLRPIGNEFYIMPPLYNLENELEEIETKLIATLAKL
jgi:adenosylmethionine-8-amino-7-oxononanoate aminotransferase